MMTSQTINIDLVELVLKIKQIEYINVTNSINLSVCVHRKNHRTLKNGLNDQNLVIKDILCRLCYD